MSLNEEFRFVRFRDENIIFINQADDINEVIRQMKVFGSQVLNHSYTYSDFMLLRRNIRNFLRDCRFGCFYDLSLMGDALDAYNKFDVARNNFFDALYEFLHILSSSGDAELSKLATNALFVGSAYLYKSVYVGSLGTYYPDRYYVFDYVDNAYTMYSRPASDYPLVRVVGTFNWNYTGINLSAFCEINDDASVMHGVVYKSGGPAIRTEYIGSQADLVKYFCG